MSKTVIVGMGIVGKNIYDELIRLNPDYIDINTGSEIHLQDGLPRKMAFQQSIEHLKVNGIKYDLAIICVPTPLKDNKKDLNMSYVFDAINEVDADIYLIKSTIGVDDYYSIKYSTKNRVVFSPEYYGNTQHNKNFEFNYTILGGDKEDCIQVQQILQKVYDARHTFRLVSPEVAIATKFMENSYLANIVSFCNQFYELCNKLGIDYEDVRECFILDPRVNPSHTFVYREHPYYESICLDKDVPTIANQYELELLQDMIKFNEKQKDKYKGDK